MTRNAPPEIASALASAGLDRLSAVLDRFRVRATLFHTGVMCGHQTFERQEGRAFIHVLRRGEMSVRHLAGETHADSLHLSEPTLLFYPRPVHHIFINPPTEGADFTCATLHFGGGAQNPIVQSLPPLIQVPLRAISGLTPALDLLFSEVDQLRCGSRVLADRLFEVVLIQLLRWIIDNPDNVGVTDGLVMGLSDPRLAKALVAIHKTPDETWTLAQMAAAAGMSRSAFASHFKAVVGVTPAAYLSRWRMSLAASMMRAGRPVKEVALDLGFAGPASFSRAFRQAMGTSPREWLATNPEEG